MDERERVIYDLERCTCHVPDACRDCSKYGSKPVLECMGNLMMDALALLKEQETIVLCKDCKNAVVYDDNKVICAHIDSNGNDKHSIDWFCADGERR